MFAKKVKPKVWGLPVKYSNLTPRERIEVRLEYITRQKGRCYYCNRYLVDEPPLEIRKKKIHKELFPTNFFKYLIHLHHNHDTDLTIGAVHCYCNAVLWEHEGE